MKRLTETNKWKDSFYVNLHPNAKLLLVYMYDNADDAGFIDYLSNTWKAELKIDIPFIKNSLAALKPLLIWDNKKKIFIKDFLLHQMKLPLDRENREHQWIISKLESNLPKFSDDKSIQDILDKVVDNTPTKGKAKREVKRFIVPSYEEFKASYLKEKPDIDELKIKTLFEHYVSVGWTVGKDKKPMSDYEACIRKAILRDEEYANKNSGNGNGGYSKKPSRAQTSFNVVDKLTKKTSEHHQE